MLQPIQRGPAGANGANGLGWTSVCESGILPQNFTSTTPADVSGMSMSVGSNKTYHFKFVIRWFRSNTGNGPVFTVTVPSGATVTALVAISHSGDGTTGVYFGRITSSGDQVKPGSSPNEVSVAIIEGFVATDTQAGPLQLQCADGTGTQTTTVLARSVGYLYQVTP